VSHVHRLGSWCWHQLLRTRMVCKHGLIRKSSNYSRNNCLTPPAHHLHIQERILRERLSKASVVLRRRREFCRKSDWPNGERSHTTTATPRDQYGHGLHLYLQRCRMHSNILLLRLETYTRHRLLSNAHHPGSRVLPNQI